MEQNPKMEGHLGRAMLETLKKYEDRINQIEVVNDITETHGSIRLRSIRMAQSLKAKGIKKGDIILFGSVNHTDTCIPYIASIYLGAAPVSLAVEMKHGEIKHIASMANPTMVFADPNMAPNIQKVLKELNNEARIVTFGDERCDQFDHFSDYIKETGTEESFECEDFDPKTTIAVLACSSGTTGLPKLVSISHYSLYFTIVKTRTMTEEERKATRNLNFSPMYWMSGIISVVGSCLTGCTRIQSCKPFSPIEFEKASKIYNATAIGVSQIVICSMVKYAETNKVTFPSFKQMFTGGSAVSEDAIENMKKILPNAVVIPAYGATENSLISVSLEYRKGSCGKPLPYIQWKIVDVNTEEKLGPNKEGELRLKSIISFLGYYNNPEATKAAFDDEGYYKTGDLVYYDEDGYFYIVDRIKELIKYRHHQMSSTELENIINDIPGIFLSAVVGIPHPEDGEHPMAFVQLEPGATVTKDTIVDFVKENMSDPKQLRGGVVFVESIPVTYSGKVNRKELRQMKLKYIKK